MEDRSKVVKTAFKMLDLDRDGFITKEEFIQVHISTFPMNYGGKISSYILIHYTSPFCFRRQRRWIKSKLRWFLRDLTWIKMEDWAKMNFRSWWQNILINMCAAFYPFYILLFWKIQNKITSNQNKTHGGSPENVMIGVKAPVYCNLFIASLKEAEKWKVGAIT